MQSSNQALIIPKIVACTYQEGISAFECPLWIQNTTNDAFYFSISSTFGRYMNENCKKRNVQRKSVVKLDITIKRTNYIKQNQEYIVIHYSKRRLSELTSTDRDQRVDVKLQFKEELVNDKQIENFLKEEVENINMEADQLFTKGLIKKAMHKYEESFQLYRQNKFALLGLIKTNFLMQIIEQSLKDLETLIAIDSNKQHLHAIVMLKTKILLALKEKDKEKYSHWGLISYCKKMIKQLILDAGGIVHEDREESRLMKKIEKIDEEESKDHKNELKQNLFKKALLNFQSNEKLKSFYMNKNDFHQELQCVFDSKQIQRRLQQTPEYVLDPISYEIMKDPVILPTGTSFDKEHIFKYFVVNGFKDPFSRAPIKKEWIFANSSIKQYIENHSQLKIWKQYEQQMSSF